MSPASFSLSVARFLPVQSQMDSSRHQWREAAKLVPIVPLCERDRASQAEEPTARRSPNFLGAGVERRTQFLPKGTVAYMKDRFFLQQRLDEVGSDGISEKSEGGIHEFVFKIHTCCRQ